MIVLSRQIGTFNDSCLDDVQQRHTEHSCACICADICREKIWSESPTYDPVVSVNKTPSSILSSVTLQQHLHTVRTPLEQT